MTSSHPTDPRVNPELIKITKLFVTPLASLVYPDHQALNDELRGIILERAAQDQGTQRSNEGGWQSPDNLVEWTGEAGARLVSFAQAFANQISAVNTPDHGLVEAHLEWTYNAWANVNRRGDVNALHGHPGSFWSGVYWVDDGGRDENPDIGGLLEFVDPRGLMPTLLNPALRMRIEGCLGAGSMSTFAPSTGTLLMFPSWLLHGVRRYNGDRPRISIAFNFSV